jgi:hypothetical protein
VRRVKPLAFVASCLLGGAALLVAIEAGAERQTATPEADDPSLRPIFPERRNGLTLGVAGGLAFAGSSGYPNSAKLQGNPDFYSSSPLLAGWSSSYFLMGAFNDYLSFGPMVTIATFESDRWKSTGFGGGFRAEVFPFVKLVPAIADLAAYGQVGLGATELRAKGPYPSADGVQSFLGLGLHHEWRLTRLLGGHASAGPYVEYDVIRAPSVERHWATVGLRVVWYSGGVKLDR